MDPLMSSPVTYTFRSGRGVASTIAVLLGLHIVIDMVSSGSSVVQIELLNRMSTRYVAMGEINANDSRQQWIAILSLVTWCLAAVAFAIWMNRTNKNAMALGSELQFGPNSWGWFFCPVANLWKPYQAVSALWDASAAGSGRPWFFPLWWGTFLLTAVLSRIVDRAPQSTEPYEAIAWTMIGIVRDGVDLIAAVGAIAVVRAITRAQEARRAGLNATEPPASLA